MPVPSRFGRCRGQDRRPPGGGRRHGHSEQVVAIVPLLAQVAARIAAQHQDLAGLLSAAELVRDLGPAGDGLRAVAMLVVCQPVGPAAAAWAGDCRVYGWDGAHLVRHSTDRTIGERLKERYRIVPEVARQFSNGLHVDLARATVSTTAAVALPDD
ncbi:hypothetical protein O1L60_39370 [Streptomyces diastatochromogenes]|nr:hypothetical protein [Streptomyces diastatochromogenes]